LAGFNEEPQIINDSRQKKLLKEILSQLKINPSKDNLLYFIHNIEKYKNAGVYAETLKGERIKDFSEENNELEENQGELFIVDPTLEPFLNRVYKAYQKELQNNNELDVDDILLYSLKILEENDNLRAVYKKRYSAIMVDEAQDLNVVQIKILTLIERDNLCLIGDDCQNIYEWRGSSNKLVFDFNQKNKRIFLSENYRSAKKIIEAVNKIISSMDIKIDKELKGTIDEEGSLEIKAFQDFEEEKREITANIKNLIENGVEKKKIAVLYRLNRIGYEFAATLRSEGIYYQLSNSKDLLDREEIRDIVSFLKLKVNPNSRYEFRRCLNLLKGVGKVKIAKFEELAKENNCSLVESLKFLKSLNLNPKTSEELNLLKTGLEDIKHNPLRWFLDSFGYISRMKEEYSEEQDKIEEKQENIGFLIGLFESKYVPGKLNNFLEELDRLNHMEKEKDAVVLSTVHSAKGLEWDYVFLISCNEKIFPFYKEELKNLKRDSELRLFYVALSRAKKGLSISHYRESETGNTVNRSQFIGIIDENKSNPPISLEKKSYFCESCKRKIRHRGRCLACNIKRKSSQS